jgi:polyvinyl alcohol dehydrogenase (cytochrome)
MKAWGQIMKMRLFVVAASALFVLACVSSTSKLGVAIAEEGASAAASGACPGAALPLTDPTNAPHWNGWGVDPSQSRFQPADMAQLAPEDVPSLKLKWAFGIPGAVFAFAQPTVIGGRIFVGSQTGKVYSLDAKTGCTYWEYDAGAGVRSAITVGPSSAGWVAYFGDLSANVHAVDAVTGRAMWKVQIESHPAARVTGAPLLVGTKLLVPVSSTEELIATDPKYSCCSFRGSIVALQASTGEQLWKTYTVAQEPTARSSVSGTQLMGPSGAPVWSSPTYDAKKDLIYVTTGDNYSDPPTETSDAILALNAASGKLAWVRQVTSGDAFVVGCPLSPNCPASNGPDFDFGSSAILVGLANGKRVLIAGQKSGVVTAVDPDRDGNVLWQTRVGAGGTLGGVEWGSAADGSKFYVAVSDTKITTVPPEIPGAQPSLFDPKYAWLLDGKTGGGLHALKVETGEEAWHTPHPGCNDVPGCGPGQSAAVTAMPGIVFSGGVDGHMRAYSAQDGRIVWDVDTKGGHRTVNGVAARGGSINGPGPVVVGGMLYVPSGYALWGGAPGNVLLAYSVDGR